MIMPFRGISHRSLPDIKTAEAYRGAGIANIHLGNYQDAIDSLTNGLNDEKQEST